MSRFQLASDTSTPAYTTDSENDSNDDLPYPADLSRNDFLKEDFDPQLYLSTLRNRHQTLEDLRLDLRQRSQLLNRELLDLVNGNYEEFLSLGADLAGGEDKVESVRVGLLGFEREIESVRKAVEGRRDEVGTLLREKKDLRRDISTGRALLEVESWISELEVDLGVKDAVDGVIDSDDADEVEDGDSMIQKLQRHTTQYLLLLRHIERLDAEHPFLRAQGARMAEIRRMLLLDMASALRQARASKGDVLPILKLYADVDAGAEGVKVLKGTG